LEGVNNIEMKSNEGVKAVKMTPRLAPRNTGGKKEAGKNKMSY